MRSSSLGFAGAPGALPWYFSQSFGPADDVLVDRRADGHQPLDLSDPGRPVPGRQRVEQPQARYDRPLAVRNDVILSRGVGLVDLLHLGPELDRSSAPKRTR